MLGTHPDGETVQPIASHGHRKPDRALVIAIVEMHLADLPTNGLRRRVLEQMIERERGLISFLMQAR